MYNLEQVRNYIGYLKQNSVPLKKVSSSASDLIIIVHFKDLYKIPYLIGNWKNKICEDISSIILITNDTNLVTCEIKALVDCIVCDDDFEEVRQFKKLMHSHPRLAWYTQQILKISAKKYSSKYIIIDADTLLLKPHQFFTNDIPIVRISHEDGVQYRNFENFIGLQPDERTYIPHMGAFSQKTVEAYCRFIQQNHTKVWYEVIAEFILEDRGLYSEWNSFNKFILQTFHAETRYWVNKSEPSSLLTYRPTIIDRMCRSSISFHEPH